MLLYHLQLNSSPSPDATSSLRDSGSPFPSRILEAYTHIFESSLAYIIAHEPQNAPFLPEARELQEICLTCSGNVTNTASAILQGGRNVQKDLRRKAQILSLDLPESFTRSPQIWLMYNTAPQAFKEAGTWLLKFFNGFHTLSDAKVFRTETHLFGITHCLLQEEDEIWILDAAFAPICLRPLPGGKYQFVGEVHMEGIMDGEALQSCDNPISITLE
ncbi:hypothetical protein EPUS_08423 [Endocarpon pusillum Z07020]|uniref:Uncharacterized protein n=1 Tax=Endocarpon pusillum (strain Z07020 / HMAS-L-300199) TaxID=1263415 RepID=U1HS82_ENDPU|nr:uncharacterized protein EPUS_08423 [Endocarpon pusillum Z07020]ERF72029.1 hypothetical protein EPUS_08423 [Endocarpon pusillum Z07020]